jgi:hypothetical protein
MGTRKSRSATTITRMEHKNETPTAQPDGKLITPATNASLTPPDVDDFMGQS